MDEQAWKPADVWIPINPPSRSGQHTISAPWKAKDGRSGFSRRQNPKYEVALKGLSGVLFVARPEEWFPREEPVHTQLSLYLPHLKSTPKRMRHLLIPLVTTPDWDNVAKMYGDALTRSGWVVDDKWIGWGEVRIRRSPIVGIRLRVWPDDAAGELEELHTIAGLFAGKGT